MLHQSLQVIFNYKFIGGYVQTNTNIMTIIYLSIFLATICFDSFGQINTDSLKRAVVLDNSKHTQIYSKSEQFKNKNRLLLNKQLYIIDTLLKTKDSIKINFKRSNNKVLKSETTYFSKTNVVKDISKAFDSLAPIGNIVYDTVIIESTKTDYYNEAQTILYTEKFSYIRSMLCDYPSYGGIVVLLIGNEAPYLSRSRKEFDDKGRIKLSISYDYGEDIYTRIKYFYYRKKQIISKVIDKVGENNFWDN